MVGLLDFFTGGDPEQMAQIDPRFGVPRADVRDAAVNTLGNVSALLLAAGQPIMPAQRAQLLAQIGPAAAGAGTDLYNAAQRRLMTAQMDQRRAEMEDTRRIGELMRDPEAFRSATGFELQQFAGMRPADVSQTLRQVRTQQLTQDPSQRELTALQVADARRRAGMPITQEVGGVLYEYNEQARRWTPMTSPRPQGGLEGEAEAIVLQAASNPELADTPRFAMAWNRLYGERTERMPNGDVITFTPRVPPPGLPRPTARAQAAAAGAAGGATGGAAPAAPQDAAAPAAPAGGASAAPAPQAGGETRTMTTPGGGQVTITSTQPRALSAAETTLRQETETTLSSARAAQEALRDALRLNDTAYAGPGALARATAVGLTGIDREASQATTLFNSIMTEQALGQLRAIFGGNPTEGERKILMDMGASVSMSRPQREALVRRALAAVEERIQSNERRLGEIVRGEYGRAQPGFTLPAAPAPPPPPAGFEMVR